MSTPNSCSSARDRRTISALSMKIPARRGSRFSQMFCATVRVGTSENSWKIIAIPARSAAAVPWISTGWPSTRMVPSSLL